jgi:hypothetical protein
MSNQWKSFESLGFPAIEIFNALKTIGGGGSGGEFKRRTPIGHPLLCYVGFSEKGTPQIEGLATSKLNTVVEQCRQALKPAERWISRAMILKRPLLGVLDGGWFRIRPAAWPDSAQTLVNSTSSDVLPSPFLAIVDVRYDGCTDPFVKTDRMLSAGLVAEGMASLLTWPPAVPIRGVGSNFVWVPKPEGWECQYLPVGFSHTEVADRAPDELPKLTAGKMTQICHERFVAGPLDLPEDECMCTTNQAATALDNYTKLNGNERAQFSRSLFWLVEAELAQSPTLRVMSFAAAVECLLSKIPGKPCSECGQSSYSVTKKFNAFLSMHAASALRAKFLKDIYSVRSGLVHGVKAYDADESFFGISNDRFNDELKASAATRAALLNFLLQYR